MIVINGSVTDEVKQLLLSGGSHCVARRHANLIIAGGCYTGCKKIEFVVTGDETFNFQTANHTAYFKYSPAVNIPHDDIVCASCTHFKWGSGAVIGDMNDGEFIFNYTKSSGIGTGNVSFRNNTLFNSTSDAKAWFEEQVGNGTPVTITAYIKE